MSKKILTMFMVPLFAFGMSACTAEQTEEGDMPEVEVEEGELPAYDVDAADVDVEQDTVTVPDIEVGEPEAGQDTGSMNMEEGNSGM